MFSEFEKYIETYFATLKSCRLTEAMYYALRNGKRVRPGLLFAVLEGFDFTEQYGYSAALALEMVHAYSLVHDDLPCMDNDDLRRGMPTVHKAYGEDLAVLAGDGLLTHAFGVLADSDYEKDIVCQMISELSSLAGLSGMLYGQFLDITHSDSEDIDEELLSTIAEAKTGALFECALFMAMYLVDDEEHIAFYSALASKIGRVFQLQDDLFDVIRDSELTGKSASDQRNNKATAFSVYHRTALEQKINDVFASIDEDIRGAHFNTMALRNYIESLRRR